MQKEGDQLKEQRNYQNGNKENDGNCKEKDEGLQTLSAPQVLEPGSNAENVEKENEAQKVHGKSDSMWSSCRDFFSSSSPSKAFIPTKDSLDSVSSCDKSEDNDFEFVDTLPLLHDVQLDENTATNDLLPPENLKLASDESQPNLTLPINGNSENHSLPRDEDSLSSEANSTSFEVISNSGDESSFEQIEFDEAPEDSEKVDISSQKSSLSEEVQPVVSNENSLEVASSDPDQIKSGQGDVDTQLIRVPGSEEKDCSVESVDISKLLEKIAETPGDQHIAQITLTDETNQNSKEICIDHRSANPLANPEVLRNLLRSLPHTVLEKICREAYKIQVESMQISMDNLLLSSNTSFEYLEKHQIDFNDADTKRGNINKKPSHVPESGSGAVTNKQSVGGGGCDASEPTPADSAASSPYLLPALVYWLWHYSGNASQVVTLPPSEDIVLCVVQFTPPQLLAEVLAEVLPADLEISQLARRLRDLALETLKDTENNLDFKNSPGCHSDLTTNLETSREDIGVVLEPLCVNNINKDDISFKSGSGNTLNSPTDLTSGESDGSNSSESNHNKHIPAELNGNGLHSTIPDVGFYILADFEQNGTPIRQSDFNQLSTFVAEGKNLLSLSHHINKRSEIESKASSPLENSTQTEENESAEYRKPLLFERSLWAVPEKTGFLGQENLEEKTFHRPNKPIDLRLPGSSRAETHGSWKDAQLRNVNQYYHPLYQPYYMRYPERPQLFQEYIRKCVPHPEKESKDGTNYSGKNIIPLGRGQRISELSRLIACNGLPFSLDSFDSSDDKKNALTVAEVIENVMMYAPDRAPETLYEMFTTNTPHGQFVRRATETDKLAPKPNFDVEPLPSLGSPSNRANEPEYVEENSRSMVSSAPSEIHACVGKSSQMKQDDWLTKAFKQNCKILKMLSRSLI